MNLLYNGIDITERVGITAAVGHDVSGCCCDYLELEFENAALWLSWNPKIDDTIEMINGNYSSGVMYISAIYPQENKFRILATAIPSTARKKLFVSYSNMELSGIVNACAIESGMDYRLYGIDNYRYGYMIRNHESCAAFLERVARMEGAVLKCWNGRYTVIGIKAAQNLKPQLTIEQNESMTGFEYTKDDRLRAKKLTVVTPYASYTAIDTGANGNETIICTDLPAVNDAQAARWARGLLLNHNRRAETLTVQGSFNPGQTAMTRFDVSGSNNISGEWIIDEVIHDHFNGSSTAIMLRCIDTVV